MKKTALGFTLIELLVVISIIGILATLVAANLNSARSRARDAERKSDLKNIQTALRLYYNDNNSYPPSGYFDNLWGREWNIGSTVYMNTLPQDPLSSQTYKYLLGSDTDSYTLSACMENTSDTSCKSISSLGGWTCSSGCVFQLNQ